MNEPPVPPSPLPRVVRPETQATSALASVLNVLGWLLTTMAAGMLLPTFVALSDHERTVSAAFAATALAGAFLGGGLMVAMQGIERPATLRENIFLIVSAWTVVPLVGALPVYASGATATFVDAFFEAMSALTTTGASALADPVALPRAVLLWRALLEWGGGFAAIVMALAILSAFGTAGRDVQRTHLALGMGGPVAARFMHFMRALFALYVAMTFLGFIGIWASGPPAFDALCLTLASISTGGLAIAGQGQMISDSPIAAVIIVILMVFGATNFLTHWTVWRRGILRYREDQEIGYLLFTAAAGFVLFELAQLVAHGSHETLRRVWGTAFNVISLVTTTGFWIGPDPPPAGASSMVALALTTIGGATVSAAGGLKLLRLALLTLQGQRELRRLSHPRSVTRVLFDGHPMDERVVVGISSFALAYGVTLALSALTLAAIGLDPTSSIVASAAALANTGPLYDIVTAGPASYATMPDAAKWALTVVMAAGRLEVLALLSLFSTAFWRG